MSTADFATSVIRPRNYSTSADADLHFPPYGTHNVLRELVAPSHQN
jgi:hypothetical protein